MQYGVLVLVLLGACSSSHGVAVDAKPAIDAMPDAESCPADMQVDGCVFNGLVGLPFDGTTPWTLTGTVSANGTSTTQFTRTQYFLRQGCTLHIDQMPITNPTPGTGDSITDTSAGYSDTVPNDRTDWLKICVYSDGALHWDEGEMRSLPMSTMTVTGILTHP